jgi:hypothetical protein
MTMYRPTVRYDDVFRDYINNLFHATHLDRNQLIRGALFAAAQSKEFQTLLKPYQKKDVPLPSPLWKAEQHCFWMEQSPKIKGEGGDVNANNDRAGAFNKDSRTVEGRAIHSQGVRRIGPTEGRPGAIPSQRISIKEQGGISFTVN